MITFDQRAATWDAKPMRTERANTIAAAMQKRLPLTPAMTAFEYGCGTGLLSFALQPFLGHITLADSSDGMLAVLRDKIVAQGISNMTPVKLDLLTDPLPETRYDLIYTMMTLHHIADTDEILRRFYALLKPSGGLFIADLDNEDGTFHTDEIVPHHGFDRAAFGAKAARAGFQQIDFCTVFSMTKEIAGQSKVFPVFLMTAKR